MIPEWYPNMDSLETWHWSPPGFMATIERWYEPGHPGWSYTIARDEWCDDKPLDYYLSAASVPTREEAERECFMWWVETQGGFDDS